MFLQLGRLDACTQFLERQETPRQSRCRVVEASNRARSVGHRVGRRASPFRSVPRGRSEAPISPSRTEGFGFRVGEDAGSDRRPCTRAIPVDVRTSCRSDGSLYFHGFGDDCGHSFGTYGSLIDEARGKRPRVEGGLAVQFEKVCRRIRHEASASGRPVTLAHRRFSDCVVPPVL